MREPPRIGTPFPALVPRVSVEDGNETSGVRPVDLRVPLATYTGWNLRSPDIGAPDMLSDMRGSFIPFARTRAERDAARSQAIVGGAVQGSRRLPRESEGRRRRAGTRAVPAGTRRGLGG